MDKETLPVQTSAVHTPGMWALLRNFTANKFFQAAKSGTFTGSPPFTFGAVFALEDETLGPQYVFGDGDFGTDGFGLIAASASRLAAANGTLQLFSGSGQNVDGTTVPASDPTGGTFEVNDADLCNRLKAYMDTNSAPGGAGGTTAARAWPSPRATQLVYIAVVDLGVTTFVYCNGKVVGLAGSTPVLNAGPGFLGAFGGADPAVAIMIGGVFYHSAAITSTEELARHMQACKRAQDVVNLGDLSGGDTNLDYIWSVKQSRLWDGRTSWPSFGAQTPLSFTRAGIGTPTLAGPNADIIATDLDWMTV